MKDVETSGPRYATVSTARQVATRRPGCRFRAERGRRVRDDLSVVEYSTDVSWVRAPGLSGFFVGWPTPPSPERHLAALVGSYRVTLARHEDRVVGFANAISDGVTTAFIPWLEVLPAYQGRGIGRELVNRLLAQLEGLYSIDVTCDLPLVDFYRSLGFRELAGMGIRHPMALTPPKVR